MRLKSRSDGAGSDRRGAMRLLVRLGALAACAVALVALGAWLRGSGWLSETKDSLVDEVRGMPNWVESLAASCPHLTLDIKHKHLQKLANKRERALEIGHLIAHDDDVVPASVHLRDGERDEGPLAVKVRLKGDIVDPTVGGKWPLRVAVRGGKTFRGMKRFSLHDPSARNFLGEWIYHRALRREGVIALRYEFVSVTVNGRDMGIYALEEHFERRLVENNERREGPIVRFNEDTFWQELVHRKLPAELEQRAGAYSSAEVDGFQTSAALADPASRQQFLQAAGLLERFRSGELSTSEVFDVPVLAKYFAIVELLGAEHGARWHNARFYFDPVLGLLQPIGFDGNSGVPNPGLCALQEGVYVGWGSAPEGRYYGRLFSDPAFLRAYVAELDRVSRPEYVTGLLAEIAADLEQSTAVLHREFSSYQFDTRVLADNAETIRSMLDPVRAIHAYAEIVGDKVELEVGAIQGMPVELYGVRFGDTVVEFDEPRLLPGRLPDRAVRYVAMTVSLPAGVTGASKPLATMTCRHRMVGTTENRSEPVLPWPRVPQWSRAARAVPRGVAPAELPFLAVDERAKRIHVRPGQHVITSDLVIPAGYVLVCGQGTSFDLTESAMILSRSPVAFTGSKDNPIVIRSTDGTGQGLTVMNAGARSTLQGVQFENLLTVSRPGWQLTGAVTFYQSPVDVHSCRFVNCRSEDALNVVRAPFRLEHTVFDTTYSDAFDGDFCSDSRIADCTFLDSGNDAIDVSGSSVIIERVVVTRPGDKGISVGENSRVTARNVTVTDARIGIAAKDLSWLEVFEPVIRRCKYGYCAYQKKPEFGPSTIIIHTEQLDEVERGHMIEHGSMIKRGSRIVPPTRKKMYEFLYAEENAGK